MLTYIAPIESRAKLRECQKGVLDGREKTMDRTGKAVNRVAGAERDLQCQRTVQRTWHHTQGMYYKWRDQLLTDGAKLFERGGVDHARERLERENRKLKETIGELTIELKR